ncbi:MAG: PhoU domain-containing protein [Candidatus Omnitrophica bacterium]|nr:PhoU domain-containing protein [Candidatus Omnitrophota bacterium]
MTIDEIKTKTISMADRVYEMVELISRGFMENKSEPLSKALETENVINEMEKKLTKDVMESSRSSSSEDERRVLSVLAQAIGTLERMGDEAASLIERIEIKVSENLLFSQLGVDQFNETYNAMKESVSGMIKFLKKPDSVLKDRIINNGFHVKELVERYRKEHSDRLVKGVCTPMAANMYFDMLDFTGNLARHSSNIVKLF